MNGSDMHRHPAHAQARRRIALLRHPRHTRRGSVQQRLAGRGIAEFAQQGFAQQGSSQQGSSQQKPLEQAPATHNMPSQGGEQHAADAQGSATAPRATAPRVLATAQCASDPHTPLQDLWELARIPPLRRWIIVNTAAPAALINDIARAGGPGVRQAMRLLRESLQEPGASTIREDRPRPDEACGLSSRAPTYFNANDA